MTIEKILFALFKSEICGENLSDECKSAITPEVLPALYSVSKAHDLAHLVCEALDKNGLLTLNDEIAEKLTRERLMAVYRYEQLNYELESLCKTFEESKIEHMPLKGSVLRSVYPKPWMRTSCDIDILVHKEQVDAAVKILTEKNRYTVKEHESHDVSLFSESGLHLELHFMLFDVRVNKRGENVLTDVWERSVPTDGWTYRREMTDEMFYFFHISHMAKHFEIGGCGVRPFIDLWILNHNVEHEDAKRDRLLQEGDLSRFGAAAKRLSEVWFSEKEHDECTQNMQDYVLRGGVYGNMENNVAVRQAQKGGRFKYVLSRIFAPYEVLVVLYPSLKKRKWLFPLYQIRRWGRLLLKGKAKKSVRELRVGSEMSKERKRQTEQLLRDLGL